MKKFKFLAFLVALVCSMVTFSSCGGDDDDTDGTAAEGQKGSSTTVSSDLVGVWESTGYSKDGAAEVITTNRDTHWSQLVFRPDGNGYVTSNKKEFEGEFTYTFADNQVSITLNDKQYTGILVSAGLILNYSSTEQISYTKQQTAQ